MTPEDKQAAREALQQGRLSVEQVQELLAEADRTGRPFLDLARERGPQPPPAPAPPAPAPSPARKLPIYPALLGASLLIFAGLLVATLVYRLDRSRKDRQLEVESEQARVETERAVLDTKMAYDRRRLAQREADARAALESARQTLAWIDDRIGKDPTDPTIHDRAVEATISLNQYLDSFPDDAPALVLRSRSWELRRNYDVALRDLERALALKPELGAGVRVRLDILRKLNTKPGAR